MAILRNQIGELKVHTRRVRPAGWLDDALVRMTFLHQHPDHDILSCIAHVHKVKLEGKAQAVDRMLAWGVPMYIVEDVLGTVDRDVIPRAMAGQRLIVMIKRHHVGDVIVKLDLWKRTSDGSLGDDIHRRLAHPVPTRGWEQAAPRVGTDPASDGVIPSGPGWTPTVHPIGLEIVE